jgi:hypothetical protein
MCFGFEFYSRLEKKNLSVADPATDFDILRSLALRRRSPPLPTNS